MIIFAWFTNFVKSYKFKNIKSWAVTCKSIKLEHFLSSYTKCKCIHQMSIKDLNVKPETIKLLEENIGRTLFQ